MRRGNGYGQEPRHVTPRMLDWAINGVPVYIRRRPIDGIVYASTADVSRFVREAPLETLRIPVPREHIRGWEPELDPRVIRVLAKYNRK